MIKVNATLLEEGLVEELQELIDKNSELFEDSKVVLMPDAHKTGGIPVGFTMTVPHKRVAPDFISSDVSCGMTSYLIKDYVPSQRVLRNLSRNMRDYVQVHRRITTNPMQITSHGTLGGSNHFLEIGVHDGDTLITVHSGSRALGGQVFKHWKSEAIRLYDERKKTVVHTMLSRIEPKNREDFLKKYKLPDRNIPFVELNTLELVNDFIRDYKEADQFAFDSRSHMLEVTYRGLVGPNGSEMKYDEIINTTHNYIDFDEEPWVIRKGSIKAVDGEQVIIPINMRDGVILARATNREEYNNSLPHGAGRVLSRTAAYKALTLEDFEDDMKGVISPTVGLGTLDESPRAYKSLDTILTDLEAGLTDIRVFKSVFNYKGVE